MFTGINRFNEALRDMILTCPACATQYRLKDGAIPPEGRTVRCAACKHKWHEDGDAPSEATPDSDQGNGLPVSPPQTDPRDAEPVGATIPEAAAHDQMVAGEPQPQVTEGSAQAPIPDHHGLETVETAMDEDVRPPADPYGQSQEPDQNDDYGFAAIPAMHDEDEPRRGGKLGWILGLILLVVAAAAAFWFLAPPELKARAGIAEAGESELEFVLTSSDRQRLASGNELLAISGRVVNSTDRELAVPPILAQLRDPKTKRLVYQWTIAPPARSLAPGQAAPFNSAEVDVPQGGESLSLSFAS